MLQAIYYISSGLIDTWGATNHFMFTLSSVSAGLEIFIEFVLLFYYLEK